MSAGFRESWAGYVPYGLLVLGVVSIYTATQQYRARSWAGVGSVVLGAIVAMVMIGWTFYLLQSVISCIMYLTVPLSCLTTLLSAVAVGGVRATARARQRLSDRGMDLGL